MKKYYSLELLRFLTSISVLLYHYRHFFGPYNNFSTSQYLSIKKDLPFNNFLNIFYDHGIFGVHVFYCISGFVFAHVYLSINKKITFKHFFLNRFARLYPLHFATLIIVSLIQFVNFKLFNTFQIVELNDLYHFMLQVFFISSWGFESGHSFNAPIWSVSVEVAIYFIFFFMIKYLRKFKTFLTLFIIITLLIINKLNINNTLFLECARLFFSGVLVYYICLKNRLTNYLLLFSIFLIFLALIGNYKTYLFCPAILMFFVLIDSFINSDKLKEIFKSFGNLTYSLYLLHLPTQLIIIIILNYLNLSSIIMTSYILFFLYFIFLSSMANYSFKFYEKPLNKKIRNKFIDITKK